MKNILIRNRKKKNKTYYFKGIFIIFILPFLFSYGCASVSASKRGITDVKIEEKKKSINEERLRQKEQQHQDRIKARENKKKLLAEKKQKRQQELLRRQEVKRKTAEEKQKLLAEKEALKTATLKLQDEEKASVESRARKEQVGLRQIQEDLTEMKQQLVSLQEKLNRERLDREALKTTVVPSGPLSPVIYHIDKGDVLEISVWQHPELSCEAIVRPDGMISFPPLGDIKAMSLSLPELNEEIAQGLNEFAKRRLKPLVSKESEEKTEYLIDAGDTLNILVWDNPELSKEIMVQPDGMFSYPFIGEIEAAGLSMVQLRQKLTEKLSVYIKDPLVSVMVKSFSRKDQISTEISSIGQPVVTVKLKNFGSKKVIVLGEVLKPGVYTFEQDIRLLETLALAGDCTKYAIKSNIIVIRGDIHKNPTVISANVLELFKRAKLSENVVIQPQDIVFVPRSLIGNINTFIESIAPIVDTIYKGATTQKALE